MAGILSALGKHFIRQTVTTWLPAGYVKDDKRCASIGRASSFNCCLSTLLTFTSLSHAVSGQCVTQY